MKVAKKNNLEVHYNELLIEKVREAFKKQSNEEVTEDEIFDFIKKSMSSAIDKGYAVHE